MQAAIRLCQWLFSISLYTIIYDAFSYPKWQHSSVFKISCGSVDSLFNRYALTFTNSVNNLACMRVCVLFDNVQLYVKKGQLDAKMLGALLTGVNRAFPFMKGRLSVMTRMPFFLTTDALTAKERSKNISKASRVHVHVYSPYSIRYSA